MPRQKLLKPMTERICEACAAVNAVPKRGKNKKYPYQTASDIEAAFRLELFKRGVLLLANESEPKYRELPTNGEGMITECQLSVAYRMTDGKETIGPDVHNGVGRDIEDKGLYKAKTGARKYYLKGLGLIPDEADDPEYDGEHQDVSETLEDIAPRRVPRREQPIREFEVNAFYEACDATHKTPEQITAYLQTLKLDEVAKLKRWQFKNSLAWASNGAGTLAPKLQAALQGSLPLPRTAPSFEMSVGGKRLEVQPKTGSYAL